MPISDRNLLTYSQPPLSDLSRTRKAPVILGTVGHTGQGGMHSLVNVSLPAQPYVSSRRSYLSYMKERNTGAYVVRIDLGIQ